jgi:ethanolaminephosphotransferase
MLPTPAIVWLFILIAVELSGMFLFSRGFFPHKSHVDGFASPEDIPIPPGQATIDACQMLTQVSSVEKGQTEINKLLDTCLGIEPQFDRLIFMVVDSLRHDFIFDASSGMTFTQR